MIFYHSKCVSCKHGKSSHQIPTEAKLVACGDRSLFVFLESVLVTGANHEHCVGVTMASG